MVSAFEDPECIAAFPEKKTKVQMKKCISCQCKKIFTFCGNEILVKGFDMFGSFKTSETAAGNDDLMANDSNSI